MKTSDFPDPGDLEWRVSLSQAGYGGVMVAHHGGTVLFGHAGNPDGPVAGYTSAEWHEFLRGVKAGEFDDLLNDNSTSFNLNAAVGRRDAVTEQSAQAAARLGARLAGRKRINLREAWLADIAHAVNEGDLTASLAFQIAVGYLICALRLRAKDIRATGWRALRYVVISSFRTHLVICLLLAIWIAKIFVDQGIDGITSDLPAFVLGWTGFGVGANRLRARLRTLKEADLKRSLPSGKAKR